MLGSIAGVLLGFQCGNDPTVLWVAANSDIHRGSPVDLQSIIGIIIGKSQ